MKRSTALTSTLAARQQREAFVLQRGTVAIYKGVGQPLWGSDVEVPGWLASVLLDTSARDFLGTGALKAAPWDLLASVFLEALGTKTSAR